MAVITEHKHTYVSKQEEAGQKHQDGNRLCECQGGWSHLIGAVGSVIWVRWSGLQRENLSCLSLCGDRRRMDKEDDKLDGHLMRQKWEG